VTANSRRQTGHRLARYLVASAISFAVIENAFGADEFTTSLRQCATRDLQILMSLEKRDVTLARREELRAEIFVLQEARRLCDLHLIPEALAVYDRVLRDTKPISAARSMD
jgi:hypothetical protein